MKYLTKKILFQVLEEIPAIVVLYRDKIIYANPFACTLAGYSLQELKKKNPWEFTSEQKREEIRQRILNRIKGRFLDRIEGLSSFVSKEGKHVHIKYIAKTVKIEDEYYGLLLGIDISKEVEQEEKLRNFVKKLEELLRYISDVIIVVDENGFIRYESPSVERILGYGQKERIGKSIFEYIHPNDRERLKKAVEKIFKNPGALFTVEYREKDKTEKWKFMETVIYLPDGWEQLEIEGAIFNERDNTKKRQIERSIQELIEFDQLTGLPRQSWFLRQLRHHIFQRKEGNYILVLVLNIADFERINLVYGTSAGNSLLKDIASRLKSLLNVTVSRLFGDSFALFTSIKDLGQADEIILHLKRLFLEPFKVKEDEIKLSFYAGASIYPVDGSSAEELLRKADIALFKAKEHGEDSILFYSSKVEKEVLEKEILKSSLFNALEKKQFKVYYQPIIEIKSEKVAGFEALLRWIHPDFGLLCPDKFISVAENSGFIFKLGEFVLDSAIASVKRLQKEFQRDFYVTINFSLRQFLDESLLDIINNYLNVHNFNPSDLILEITERTAMQEPEKTKQILNKIRKRGIKIAIDDFGTAYSSLEYLIEFEVDKIKIDKKFVLSMLNNKKAMTIVKMTIGLCKALNIVSVAEGVETQKHLIKLKDFGCREAQGYYFSPPVELSSLIEFIKERI